MAGHFGNHGLRDLTPDGCDPIVDLVFVHGLHGNSEDTWTAKSKSGNVFWPRDLLPKDIKQARILTWGYDSFITHFWNKTSAGNVDTHAMNLCADLSSFRERTKTTDRPIIFVAHSLGGIVCANTLVLAQNSAEVYANDVARLVRGIVFLGTPHEGSDKINWAKLGERFVRLFKTTNKEHIQILEKDSVKLADISSAFQQLLRRRRESTDLGSKIEVVCFFEEKETSIGFIVPEKSATFGSYDKASIAADHRAMCKFTDETNPGYVRIKGFLERWISDLDDEEDQKTAKGGGTVNIAKWFGGTNFGQQIGQGGRPTQTINLSGNLSGL